MSDKILAECHSQGYSNQELALYKVGETYEVDPNVPWNWRHFIFPREVNMPAEVRDIFNLSKSEAENFRGKKVIPNKQARVQYTVSERKAKVEQEAKEEAEVTV